MLVHVPAAYAIHYHTPVLKRLLFLYFGATCFGAVRSTHRWLLTLDRFLLGKDYVVLLAFKKKAHDGEDDTVRR